MKLRQTVAVAAALASSVAFAQLSSTNPQNIPQYGPNVTMEQAKKALAAAEAEARNRGWPVAVAIVDNAGQLVAFVRMDNTQTSGGDLAIAKAKTAAMFRRPSKAMQDGVASGGVNLRYLVLPGALPFEGGNPLYADGKIVGGIGVSGMAADQDNMVSMAGVAALK